MPWPSFAQIWYGAAIFIRLTINRNNVRRRVAAFYAGEVRDIDLANHYGNGARGREALRVRGSRRRGDGFGPCLRFRCNWSWVCRRCCLDHAAARRIRQICRRRGHATVPQRCDFAAAIRPLDVPHNCYRDSNNRQQCATSGRNYEYSLSSAPLFFGPSFFILALFGYRCAQRPQFREGIDQRRAVFVIAQGKQRPGRHFSRAAGWNSRHKTGARHANIGRGLTVAGDDTGGAVVRCGNKTRRDRPAPTFSRIPGGTIPSGDRRRTIPSALRTENPAPDRTAQ